MIAQIFGLMLVGHALADYPLQGDFLARAKNHTAPLPGIPWQQALGWHAMIHAGFVGVISGSIALGICEFIMHTVTDYGKCAGRITFNQDQAIHVACKVMWCVLIYLKSF